MQRTGATKGATDFLPADRFADMMHHDESGLGSIPQAQQGLAQSRHGAGIVFILIMSGVERIQDDDFGGGGLRRGQEVLQSLRSTQQMSSGSSIDQQMMVRRRPQATPH